MQVESNPNEDPRIQQVLHLIRAFASGDLEARGSASEHGDELDGIITGLNMLAEELAHNIAERQQAREALRDSEELYRSVVENANDAISIESRGKLVFVNRAFLELHGLSVDSEAIGMPHDKFILPEDRGLVMQGTMVQEKDGPRVYEYRIRRADDEVRAVQTVWVGIFYKGQPASLGIIRDFTEGKRVEERIREADRLAAVGELAAGVAHEVKNELTIIQGYSQRLLERELGESAQKDVLTIFRGAKRVAQVVQDLVALGRQRRPVSSEITVTGPLQKALRLKTYDFQANRINLELEIAADLPRTMADESQLLQVFLNVLTNAQQAMVEAHGRGKLRVNCKRVGSNARLSFADNGPGIAKGHLSRIFDPFYTGSQSGNGTGLGLSVSHGIILAHRGNIWAESEPGQGATFHIELPGVTVQPGPQGLARTTKEGELTAGKRGDRGEARTCVRG